MERTMASDVAQCYELWSEWAAAAESGDFPRFMTLWDDDAIQMAPDAPRRVGKEQIQEANRPTFDLFVMSDMVINTEEVRVMGDLAYSHGSFTFDMVAKEGGDTLSLAGKFLDILARQADGSWKIAIDCHNYDGPPA